MKNRLGLLIRITSYNVCYTKLLRTPFMDSQSHGIFATRSPKRPNAIGISTVKLISINENILTIEEADMLNRNNFV